MLTVSQVKVNLQSSSSGFWVITFSFNAKVTLTMLFVRHPDLFKVKSNNVRYKVIIEYKL